MIYQDYYKILGIDKEATPKDIKNAYRRLARKYHPDLNPNNKDAKKNFQQINEANEVLSDPEKRKKYDQYGNDWQHADQFEKAKQNQRQSSNTGRARYSEMQSDSSFSDFFEAMFGGSSGSGGSRSIKFRGEDYKAELQLDLADAYRTHKRSLIVNNKNIRITIPAGIENGQTIKISGHGGPGINGGPDGDLFISFSIASHPRFKRLGNDLYTSLELDIFTAILGGELIIETLAGKVKLKVKPETQNGTKIRLKNKGFPVYKNEGQFGDLILTYTIKIPTNLTEKQKELFVKFSESILKV